MNLALRRLLLDVDKPIKDPSMFAIIDALEKVENITAVNVTVEEMDVDVMGLLIVVDGEGFQYSEVENALDSVGAIVHSVDQIVAGTHLIDLPIVRPR